MNIIYWVQSSENSQFLTTVTFRQSFRHIYVGECEDKNWNVTCGWPIQSWVLTTWGSPPLADRLTDTTENITSLHDVAGRNGITKSHILFRVTYLPQTCVSERLLSWPTITNPRKWKTMTPMTLSLTPAVHMSTVTFECTEGEWLTHNIPSQVFQLDLN